VNQTSLKTLCIAFPQNMHEQQRIAERLSAIDAKIADELAVIAKYRKVKTGLMARLLTPPPGVEIVDGGVE
jgi:restriction endonuclease S subunit